MSRNKITLGRINRRSSPIVALVGVLALVGCGGGGADDAAPTKSDKAADVQQLNYALARELTAVDAYARGLPLLQGRMRAVGRQFHAQEQEHVDAINKAIRGLGGETNAEPSPLDHARLRTQAEFLALAYHLGGSLIRFHTEEIAKLITPWPRSLLTLIVANEAQQLVVLRQALGASQLATVPEAFEAGKTLPPGEVQNSP